MNIAEPNSPTDRIQSIFHSILSEIQKRPSGNPKIILKRIATDRSNPSQQQIIEREVTYRWPGKNREEAWRFACVGKILAEIHEALQKEVTVTKRDIYYRDPQLFGKQALVDRYVDDIAFTFNVTRRDLNVTASAKGLHAGLSVPSLIDKGVDRIFDVVPDSLTHLREQCFDHLNWILVIEKEATFRSLVDKRFHAISAYGPGLMVTAKGYPDLSTRRFLRTLYDHAVWSTRSRPPMLGLFDADPDGMNILQIYRHGSYSLPHENAVNMPEMQWLGVRVDDVLGRWQDDEAVLRLTERDRSKAVAMLRRLCEQPGDSRDGEYQIELQRMLMLNIKGEIQILEDRLGGLEGWLDDKIRKQLSRH